MNTITSGQKEKILNLLNSHPELETSLNALCDIITNSNHGGGFKTADQAEMDLIIEIKKLGKKSLTIWSQNQAHEAEKNIAINNFDISSKGKKTSLVIYLWRNRNN